jgi:short-subunit dehydrogenase
MNLRGKTAVITGASSGIGSATALEMARRGVHVILGARRVQLLESIAAECRTLGVEAVAVPTDVTIPEDCRRLIGSRAQVDILVNNAGFGILDLLEEARFEDLRLMMETNYFGMVHCTQAVLPQMLERGSGSIVNISSILGIMGVSRMGGYCATKFAVNGFTESLRDEVIGRGLKVALVCPATTETEFFLRAERNKMPAASRLLPAVTVARVARAICDAAADGRYRRILPPMATAFMRMKEIFPRLAHLLMRGTSSLLERR